MPYRIITGVFPSIFYGWVLVAVVFLIAGTAAGLIYAFPAFFDSIAMTFNASRAQVSAIFAGAEFVWFMSGFLGGYLADRIGPAKVVLLGSVLMSSGLFLSSQANTLSVLIIAYALGVGIGGGLIYIPSISLIQRWFKRYRGIASGIAICGTGVGTLLFPLIGERLVSAYGWALSHMVFSAIALTICGGLSFLLIASPEKLGTYPDGVTTQTAAATPQNSRGKDLAEAVRLRPFWHLYVASLFTSSAIFTTYVHLVPYAVDHGNERSVSVALIGAVGVSSVVGRFLFGGVSDRLGGRKTISLMFAGLAVSVGWWLLSPPNIVNLFVYALVFGAFYGGYISILPALTMSYFGGRQISSIIGALYTSWGLGALLGPTMTGFLFDISGSYEHGLIVAVVLLTLAAISCMVIKDPTDDY